MLRILLTSWYRPLQSSPWSSPAWRAATVVVEIYSLMGMAAGVTATFGPFCSKDFSSGVSSFLERLITHLSWILQKVEEVNAVLKVLVVLEAILKVVVEDLEMRCLSFLIWVFLYGRNVFSLLLKMVFILFLLQRCHGVSYFSLEVVDLNTDMELPQSSTPHPRGHLLHFVFQHERQLTLHTFLISIYNRSVIPMFTPFKLQDS